MEENIAQFVSDTVTELFDMLGKGEVGFKQFWFRFTDCFIFIAYISNM